MNIYTFQLDTQCCSTDCLLMLRCQLYMFRTVTVHPQELLFRCCMCRLWYVVRNALSDTSRWYNVWGSSSSKVVPVGRISTYRSLHIQHLKRSSWGWTVTVRNMYSWHLSINKQTISTATLCISLECIYTIYLCCVIYREATAVCPQLWHRSRILSGCRDCPTNTAFNIVRLWVAITKWS